MRIYLEGGGEVKAPELGLGTERENQYPQKEEQIPESWGHVCSLSPASFLVSDHRSSNTECPDCLVASAIG
jgi:hypothetical protein